MTGSTNRMNPLIFLNFGHFLDHYVLLIFPTAVLVIGPIWQMSYAEALALSSPMFMVFALATLPAGWLGDRWSRHHMLSLFYLGVGLCCCAAGLAPGPLGLSVSLAALGLFAAIYHPVGIAMVTEASARKGQALAVNGVWGNMGLAGATICTGLLTDQFGWRASFLFPGVIAILVGAAHVLQAGDVRTVRAGCGHNGATVERLPDGRQLTRVLMYVAAAALFGGIIFNAVSLSLPKLLEERLVSPANGLGSIGAYASVIFAVAGFAQLPVGYYLDRYPVRPLLFALFVGQLGLLYLASWVTQFAIVPVAMVLVLMMFAWIPVSSWLVGTYVPSGWRSRVFSLEYTLSLGTTALIVPGLSWLHGSGLGFEAQYLALAACAAIVLMSAFLLPGARQGTQAAQNASASG